ncbi:uncharacterized protein At2g39795, mitochondrial-like [Ananas comosus]|uniref:Uncharacterized protein At2g39795, mitochondrial-like n=1 Tax=Ananas comosus TaxID=4615 RepID=A0A6P5FBQ3_ANACO|nr:uncharacterized protein At2g39795, mitochondrial-like [Ananas comosus]
MSSSAAAFLVRRALSAPPVFLRLRRPPSLFYSSLASSPSSFPSPARAAVPLSSARVSSFTPLRFASSSSKVSADDTLKRVIDSEIDCVVQSDDPIREVDLPDGFPFEIIDNPGDQTVVLKRELAGETIEATVFMNYDEEQDLNEDDDDDDARDDGHDESSIKPTISLVVTIQKGEGPFLEFCCNFNDDKLEIESMSIKKRDDPDAQNAYEGPEFSDLDESLQAALRRYLEARGIKRSMYDFLHEYMINKDEREYLTWLKNMKEFIEK